MKKILVTGGAGYIGSHTVVELIHSGFKPVIIDNLCNSSIKNIEGIYNITEKNVKWYNADCTNVQSIKDIFKKEFAKALMSADNVMITEIFASREKDNESINSDLIINEMLNFNI